MNNYCLYRHVRLDKNEPFYIGIGLKQRPQRKSGRNNIWNKITAKTKWKYEIILDDLTLDEAKMKEIEFIKLYGRINLNSGILANMTDGGEGTLRQVISDEHKQKIREKAIGRKMSQETRNKISISSSRPRGPLSAEHKNKLSNSKKGTTSPNKGKSKYSNIEKDVWNDVLNGYSETMLLNKYNITKGAIHRIKLKKR